MSRTMSGGLASLLIGSLVLSGCADQRANDEALHQANASFLAVRDDSNVLRSAPKDVTRAGESLARAQRLAGYWGAGDDPQHYAYLSQRYSEIAREHSEQMLNQQRLTKLQLDLQRLQLAVRDSKLETVQQQGKWLEEQILALTSVDTDRGLVMTLGDVLFDTGEAQLKPQANRTILKLVQFLQLNPKRIVRIEGYTDNTGDRAFNLKLSRERAQSVADTLIDLGVDEKRVQVEGYGDQYPVEANASERGRAQNRRVEVVFSDRSGALAGQRDTPQQ